MQIITKFDLIRCVGKETNISMATIKPIVETFLERIIEQVYAGNSISIRGFGSFYPYIRQERSYYNPRLGSKEIMQKKTFIRFKAMKSTHIEKVIPHTSTRTIDASQPKHS